MKSLLSTGLHRIWPSKDGLGSVNHRNTVSLVPKLIAMSPLFSWVPARDAERENQYYAQIFMH